MSNQPFQFVFGYKNIRRVLNLSGVDSLKIKIEKDGDNIFPRKKLNGNAVFSDKGDFDFLNTFRKSVARCGVFSLIVNRLCVGEYIHHSTFDFSITDCDFDLDNCTAKLNSTTPNDKYKKITDSFGKEYNALVVPVSTIVVSAKINFARNFEFKRIEMGKISDELDSNWTSFLETSYWINGGLNGGTRSKTQVIFRLVRSEPLIAGVVQEIEGWTVLEEETTSTTAKYSRRPEIVNFEPFTYELQRHFNRYNNLVQITVGGAFDPTIWLKVTGAGGANEGTCNNNGLNLRTNVSTNRCRDLIWNFGSFNFNRSRRLLDVIYYLVGLIDADLLPASANELSTFFQADVNYVTGLENVLKDILIAAKSDILTYNKSTEVATKANVKLNDLLSELIVMFRAFWFINDSGKFQIEHESFFVTQGAKDLTVPKYSQWLKNTNKFSYDKSKMPQFERLKYSQSFSNDFAKGEIEYTGNCVNKLEGQNESVKTISLFYNDLQALLLSTDSQDRNGFVLLVHKNGRVLNEIGDASKALLPNGHLSAANLLKWYHRENRVELNGILNGTPTTFNSVIKTIKQEPITIPYTCEDEINTLFAYGTGLSDSGELAGAEIDLNSCFVKLDILHEEDTSNLLPEPTRQFSDQFSQQFA